MKAILAGMLIATVLSGGAEAACNNGDEAETHLVLFEHRAMMDLLAKKLDDAKFSEIFHQRLAALSQEVDTGDPAAACKDIDTVAKEFGVGGTG